MVTIENLFKFLILHIAANCFTHSTRQLGIIISQITRLATEACLTAFPGVTSSIPARSHTFVEIDHEIISTVILLPSADSFKKGCCQLQAKVCARIPAIHGVRDRRVRATKVRLYLSRVEWGKCAVYHVDI